MKKVSLVVTLMAALALAFTACGNPNSSSGSGSGGSGSGSDGTGGSGSTGTTSATSGTPYGYWLMSLASSGDGISGILHVQEDGTIMTSVNGQWAKMGTATVEGDTVTITVTTGSNAMTLRGTTSDNWQTLSLDSEGLPEDVAPLRKVEAPTNAYLAQKTFYWYTETNDRPPLPATEYAYFGSESDGALPITHYHYEYDADKKPVTGYDVAKNTHSGTYKDGQVTQAESVVGIVYMLDKKTYVFLPQYAYTIEAQQLTGSVPEYGKSTFTGEYVKKETPTADDLKGKILYWHSRLGYDGDKEGWTTVYLQFESSETSGTLKAKMYHYDYDSEGKHFDSYNMNEHTDECTYTATTGTLAKSNESWTLYKVGTDFFQVHNESSYFHLEKLNLYQGNSLPDYSSSTYTGPTD